jgi:C-terminal processing protease CtpA/Prc
MYKPSSLFFFLFFVSLSVFAQKKQPYNPNKKFSAQALKEDFRQLRFAIEEFHAGAFLYTSADSLKKVFDNYEASLTDSLTERQFRNQLYPVTEAVKCGHAGVSSSKARQKYFKKQAIKILPFDLYYIDSQLVVMQNLSKDSSIKIGEIVTSIEGESTANMVKKMFAANGSDGFNLTNRYYSFERGVQFEYTRHYTEKDTFQLQFMDSTKAIRTIRVAALLSDSFPFSKAKLLKPIYKNKGNRFYLAEKDSTIAVLDLLAERMTGYRKFYKKSFKYLNDNKLDKLVVDLRGNGGGFMLNPGDLLGYLLQEKDYVEVIREKKALSIKKALGRKTGVKFTEIFFPLIPSVKRVKDDPRFFHIKIFFKPKKHHFYKGKIFVLTDGGTFSAASYIAAYLKKYNRATFIGSETGGGESGCSAFLMPHIELPNTKLQYRLPLYSVKHNTSPKLIGRGVMPDLLINYQKDNLLKMKDLEMEKVYEMLMKPQNIKP